MEAYEEASAALRSLGSDRFSVATRSARFEKVRDLTNTLADRRNLWRGYSDHDAEARGLTLRRRQASSERLLQK